MNDPHIQLQRTLTDLKYCISTNLYPHVSLSTENSCKMAAFRDESFSSKMLCSREAEHRLRELYVKAQTAFEKYSDPLSPNSFLSTFQTALNKQLALLRDRLTVCRTSENAAIVNRIQSHLTPDPVFAELTQLNQQLRAKYVLAPFDAYRTLIVYDKHDPSEFEEGVAKLIAMAFCRYGYDLLPAIRRIEEDAASALRNHQSTFDTQAALSIQKNIIAPVQGKLPLLRQIVHKERN